MFFGIAPAFYMGAKGNFEAPKEPIQSPAKSERCCPVSNQKGPLHSPHSTTKHILPTIKKEISTCGHVLSRTTIKEAKKPETTDDNKTAIPLSKSVPDVDVQ